MKLNVWESSAAGAIILFGAVMAYVGSSYGIGTLSQMGPGYFPTVLGIVTVLLGILTFLEVRNSESPRPDASPRVAIFIFGGLFVWAMLVERIGLLPSSIMLIILCSLARPPIRPVPMVATAVLVSLGAAVIFLYGFNLPLRMLRW
ncbi:tripartite tricarboxylate transporter TctB family protein [Chelativorans sp. SCAU2101]|jgi:Tripartite tricarboxylate transporter TctB family.|uniref:Tripartite tricarboxylate transporter TctB family protein n=1 Tax=Chelativorans petroleitrophicus TaxID=2975484 RepID=A0A9X3B6A5_9HYPH|nr:tripartite tricarboxylate transporter TctB family protein [Chelativorans petroleitrophicus]MCT8990263.1 tripartite tricarboxylate transporter TctB family protein [Chelativorans petroleitrophicus]